MGLNIDTGELLAIKHFHISDNPDRIEREFYNYKREVLILKGLDHPNVIKYYQTDLSSNFDGIDVIMEYISGGSLR